MGIIQKLKKAVIDSKKNITTKLFQKKKKSIKFQEPEKINKVEKNKIKTKLETA